MASSNKPSEALNAYRRAVIDDDVEKRVEELSTVVSTWQTHRAERERDNERLAARERLDEDAVADAFDAAKNAGAKPATLAKIGLRPDAAIAAARARRARATTPTAPPATTGPEGSPAAGDGDRSADSAGTATA